MFNAYVPPSAPIDEMINKIEFYMNNYLNRNLILVGDLNAKHPLWGNQRSDFRCDYLLEFFNKNDWTILNDPNSLLTFNSTTGKSCIDLVIFRKINSNRISNFMVSDEMNLSVHNLVSFKLQNFKGISVVKVR